MAYRLEFPAEAEHDFGLIFDHLLDSYLGFGESLDSALNHARHGFWRSVRRRTV